ncbi:U-box domain-containing 4-like [Olea europaea subsp. europaea]|uniref:U-box domain-containing 4-like n=1 Tax=Olea europaea subsp. europaea TaxID=158383 RepID=A0A8S0U3Y2_OLEEU|nr:U-box domain-containing 4-like [Olea europaea subsp. europaea]
MHYYACFHYNTNFLSAAIVEVMEISLLESLLNSFSRFFQLSSCENIECEPVQRYHQKVEEILKLLKEILDLIIDAEIASNEMLQKPFAGLSGSVGDLKVIIEIWQPLMSKIYFVLQVEPLMKNIQRSGLEILELLKSSNQYLPAELSAAIIEHCVQKIKHMGYEQTTATITIAIKDHVEGPGASSETLAKVADSLSLKSNQELLIEAENAAAALLQLCTNSNRFCSMVLQEGAVPPLVALSQSGTPRAREKAQQLLGFFRNQRHNNAGRG